jgi:hypothetical protein
MRVIRFRGKRVDNGQWVEGDLHHKPLRHGRITMIYVADGDEEIEDTGWVQVGPSTVGQFIGFPIGINPVYEDDLVESGNGVGRVVFFSAYSQFMIEHKDGSLENVERAYTYLGNIHDNPELINKGGNNE